MGYTIPEWANDNETVIFHFIKLFSEYMKTYEKDFDTEELEEK